MLIKKPQDIPSSEITDQAIYLDRRKFMTSSIGLTAAATLLSPQTSVAGYGGTITIMNLERINIPLQKMLKL